MCRISDKLKLCTCASPLEKLKHYWVLHRFNAEMGLEIMGTLLPPAYIDPEVDRMNQEQLLQQLNEGNVFDVEINPIEKDRLQISFLIGPEDHDRLDYGFEFRNNKWQIEDYSFFEWAEKHYEDEFGKIKNPFQTNRGAKNK